MKDIKEIMWYTVEKMKQNKLFQLPNILELFSYNIWVQLVKNNLYNLIYIYIFNLT